MKIAIIQFPGSNCERETRLAVERVGMRAIDFLWNGDVEQLKSCDGFIIIGGFSYEDRSRAGIIASKDPVMQVIAQQAALGKPVLGICNGAQILVESGLVPGAEGAGATVALATNKRVEYDKVLGTGYYNEWVHICASDSKKMTAFNMGIVAHKPMYMPIAHAEGRFVIPDELLAKIKQAGLNIFQYCDEKGEVVPEFPINPNGSVDNIAGLCNAAGNVLALMPHPERTPYGDMIFSSMRDYIAEQEKLPSAMLSYQLDLPTLKAYESQAQELLVDFVITDNVAVTVQSAFEQMGLPLLVKRYAHWEVSCDKDVLEKVVASDELYNPSKEFRVDKAALVVEEESLALLVKNREDFVGQQKYQLLANHFQIDGIKRISQGVLWCLSTTDGSSIHTHLPAVQESRILCNPVSQDCFLYE